MPHPTAAWYVARACLCERSRSAVTLPASDHHDSYTHLQDYKGLPGWALPLTSRRCLWAAPPAGWDPKERQLKLRNLQALQALPTKPL